MTILRRFNPAFLMLLMLAALALRIAVPAGFMPVADAEGIRVEICTGAGKGFIELDPGNSRGEPQRDPCPYGLAAAAALDAPPPLGLLTAPPAPLALPYPGLIAARLIAARALRPPARGPPAFA